MKRLRIKIGAKKSGINWFVYHEIPVKKVNPSNVKTYTCFNLGIFLIDMDIVSSTINAIKKF
jgi:hypothetical protein